MQHRITLSFIGLLKSDLTNSINQINSNLIKHNFITKTHEFSNTPTSKEDVHFTWDELGVKRENTIGCTIALAIGEGSSWLYPSIASTGIYIRFMYDATWNTTITFTFDVMTIG